MKTIRKLALAAVFITAVWLNQGTVQTYTWEHSTPADCGEQEQMCQSYCDPDPIIFGCRNYGADSSGWCDCEPPGGNCSIYYEYCDGFNPCCEGYHCDFEIHACVFPY